jgi:Xaa-Pro aminopeptidase
VPDPRPTRRRRILERLASAKLDAALVSHLPNIRYLSGFTGSNALLLITQAGATLLTDPRYTTQSAQECDCKAVTCKGALWTAASDHLRRKRIRRVGVEAAKLPHSTWQTFQSSLGRNALGTIDGWTDQLRTIKSPDEIASIRQSVLLNSKAYEKTLRRLRSDWSELRVAAELEYSMRKLGASGPAFETIVAAGRRSALPHAAPTGSRIGTNRILLIDMGASLDGYASDMTRVVHLGPAPDKARRLYDAVLEAQLAAIAAVRPGAACASVDAAARKVLKKKGLDKFFTHSTGHGLGLEIHEGPRIGRKVEDRLEPGMAVTIEPGVYLEQYGGVRIEDTVLVTQTGVEILTPTAKELLVLNP